VRDVLVQQRGASHVVFDKLGHLQKQQGMGVEYFGI
jgi:hypothetical protein